MGALEGLEEVAEQTSVRVNQRSRNGKFGWSIPPSIERSSAAREKKKTPKRKPIAPNPSPEDQAVTPAKLGRTIASYRTLIETCRARAEELALSRAEIDRISGLPEGFSGKLLGKDGCGPRQKKMWPVALELMLAALGLKILLIEDEAATARTLSLRTPVQRNQQRFGNVCRISAGLLEKPSPPALTIVGTKRPARRGKYG
jgi:hypothetical protein